VLAHTFVRVLPREFGDGVSNFAAHRVVGLFAQAGEQLRADGFSLGWLEGQEQVCGLAVGGLSRFRGLAPEQDGGEGASL
jgi:hypothetical protein